MAGCLLAFILVLNLQAAGRGYAVLGFVTQKSTEALEQALLAGSALAASDFSTSADHFASSESLLVEAQAKLDSALASSKTSLEILDVTGTVKSGANLIAAGESITRAGNLLAKGLEPLLEADVLPDESEPSLTVVSALQIARAQLGKANEELSLAEEALNKISVKALPNNLQEPVATLQQAIPEAGSLLTNFLDQSRIMLSVLGAEREREYLLLLQNNDEIRPTGGFIGSLALVNIDRGVVEDINVKSVYDGDGQLTDYIAPPDPLTAITDRWYLRDANWFIDWNTSASKVAEFFEKEGGTTVDGVIALTPTVIEELLKISGPIEVPGYDQVIDSETFVAVTQDLVTYSYDRQLNKPKQFLADLTPIILNKLFSGGAADSLAVLDALSRMIGEKQLLLNFRDAAEAAELRDLGWDASLPEQAQGFLHVNNANIGGHKSDQFVEQELDYRPTILANGDVEVVLTIRRTHQGPSEALKLPYPSGENPAYKTNVVYQRVLVPIGAELIEAKGFTASGQIPRPIEESQEHSAREAGDLVLDADPDVAEWQRSLGAHSSGTQIGQEAGYTVFANWLTVKPGDTEVGLYRYRLPKQAQLPGLLNSIEGFSTYVAKQPGDTRTTLRTEITLPDGRNIIHTVPEDGVTLSDKNKLVYRGLLRKDALVGAVFE